MEISEFWTICSANGIIIDKKQLKQFERYFDELVLWNRKVNLISRKDEENLIEKHILHSLSILKHIDIPENSKCIDAGTGGGLPGIPISLARPDLRILLVDSIAKKMKITKMLAQHTQNKHLSAINSRVEDLAQDAKYKNKYDFIFVRAVTKIENMIGWTKDLLNDNGKIIFLKGGDLDQEINDAKKKHPTRNFDVIDIDFFGADWFKKEDKKIIVCSKEEK